MRVPAMMPSRNSNISQSKQSDVVTSVFLAAHLLLL